ncbi:hypothetical protein PIB30_040125 [Stylosanthes scabra]|uniref:F-box domain-containing protein n=1 Tax=Stylosanthes scabra TaxID=79078 RepID=A0ABU6TE70_9FABA|nr:hypothetical protein [Stylosanthes scabra]
MAATFTDSADFPSLPHIIVSDILAMADLKTIGRCKTLSTNWKNQMQTEEFLLMHSEFVKKMCGSIYLHIDSPRMHREGKILKLHAFTGALQEMNLPFNVSEDSKFNVIGAANGIMAIRCVEADNTSQVIVWNPVSSHFRLISEFTHGHRRLSYSAYGFGISPQCIVYYSAKDNEFGYLHIPEEAVNLEKRLISIDDVLCFVGLESRDGEIYTWTIWMINSVDGSKEWTTSMKASGCGWEIRIRGLSSTASQSRTIQNMEFRWTFQTIAEARRSALRRMHAAHCTG